MDYAIFDNVSHRRRYVLAYHLLQSHFFVIIPMYSHVTHYVWRNLNPLLWKFPSPGEHNNVISYDGKVKWILDVRLGNRMVTVRACGRKTSESFDVSKPPTSAFTCFRSYHTLFKLMFVNEEYNVFTHTTSPVNRKKCFQNSQKKKLNYRCVLGTLRLQLYRPMQLRNMTVSSSLSIFYFFYLRRSSDVNGGFLSRWYTYSTLRLRHMLK